MVAGRWPATLSAWEGPGAGGCGREDIVENATAGEKRWSGRETSWIVAEVRRNSDVTLRRMTMRKECGFAGQDELKNDPSQSSSLSSRVAVRPPRARALSLLTDLFDLSPSVTCSIAGPPLTKLLTSKVQVWNVTFYVNLNPFKAEHCAAEVELRGYCRQLCKLAQERVCFYLDL
jgi:hypothetical protein